MPKVESKAREAALGRGSLLKNELREDLEVCENYINDVPNIFDPCKMCENWNEKEGYKAGECGECCWYYASKFRLKERKGEI